MSRELNKSNLLSQHLVSPHSPGGGGLALLWDKDIAIQILSSNHNFIDTYITYKMSKFFATFVYGAPEVQNRQAVWDQLSSLALTRDELWFLTGDFNEIVDNSEKSGGPARPESSFGPFRSFLSAADLFDIQHTGNFLSWRAQRGTHLVHCRLDRSIANSHWSDLFPTARSHYLEFKNSDHRPLLSTFDPKKKKPKRIFRYDRRLQYNTEVSKISEKAWKKGYSLPVSNRIANCRRAIFIWSRDHYINSRKTIDKLKTSLDTKLSRSTADEALISDLNTKLLLAYKAE